MAGYAQDGKPYSLRYRINTTQVVPGYKNNAEVMDALNAALSTDKDIAYVLVQGVASPEGPQAVNRRVARERAENLVRELTASHASQDPSLYRVSIYEPDWADALGYLSRSTHPWKDDAIAIIRSGGADREARLKDLWVGEAWDDLMRHWLPVSRRTDVRIVYAVPAADRTKASSRILFERSRSQVRADFRNNQAQLDAVCSSQADSVYLDAWASVEGTVAVNRSLSEKRAAAVKAYLVQKGVPADRIVTRVKGEDWEGLRRKVLASDSADKNRILWILDNASLSASAKKQALRELDGGEIWRHLVLDTMTDLRAVEISYSGAAVSAPVSEPSEEVPAEPSVEPVVEPSIEPVVEPSVEPSEEPVVEPSEEPDLVLSAESSKEPVIIIAPESSSQTTESQEVEPSTDPAGNATGMTDSQAEGQQPSDSANLSDISRAAATAATAAAVPVLREPRTLFGLSTNVLYDAVTAVNFGIEIPVGHHSEIRADYMFPWWVKGDNSRAFQIQHLDLGYRYYLKGWEKRDADVLRGWYLSASVGTGKFDIEPNRKGVQGKEFMASVGAGYTLPLGDWWRMDLGLGVGAMYADFQNYQWQEDKQLHFENESHYLWLGPVSAKVSFIYLFHYNRKITK